MTRAMNHYDVCVSSSKKASTKCSFDSWREVNLLRNILKLSQLAEKKSFKMANNLFCFQSAFNADWTPCDATLTRKRVVAMHGGEELMPQDEHLLPYYPQGRKLKQKTFTVGNMLQDFVPQFFTTLPCHSRWQHLLVRCLGLGRTVVEFDQWERRTDQADQGEPTNRRRPGHWPLPPFSSSSNSKGWTLPLTIIYAWQS